MPISDRRATMPSGLTERVKEVARLAARDAEAAEEKGQLTDEVIDALHDAGLFAMWTPRSLGGGEIDPVPGAEVIENVSYGDPSAGWVLFVGAILAATSGAYYGDEAVEEMYSGDRVPIVAGQGTRAGIATPKNGGYLLSGNWSFASAMKHAAYTHSFAIIEGTGQPRIFTTRVEDADLKWDSWDTLGLRATGSIDYTIDSAFVPEAFTHVPAVDFSPRGGSLYKLGLLGFISLSHAAWALGLGSRMLDELKALLAAKAGRPGTQSQSDAFLEHYFDAEARLRSARALFYEVWDEIQDALRRGDDLSEQHQTLMRLALINATWSVHGAANIVFNEAASVALRAGTLQRLSRDIQTGAQHITSSPRVRNQVARALAGLADDKRWMFLDLVDAE